MTKRALVIGSSTHGLGGVATDVACMEDVLGTFGFAVDLRVDATATRAGILDGYERLIRDSREGDAAVVYYSGHGGLAAANGSRHRFLVPVDIDRSTDDDFRGLLDVELSALQHRLTSRTRNVTVLLDCCHAARMSRDRDLFPRALARSWTVGVAAHLEQLRSARLTGHVESNPYAVRLAAAGPSRSAYEHTNANGVRVGMFTESLYEALLESHGLAVTWNAVGRRIREQLCEQRCEVEGPHGRVLFGLDEVDHMGVLSFFLDHGRPSLRGGRIFGVEVGDVYAIQSDASEPVRATVTEVGSAVSRVALAPGRSVDEIVDGALAFPSPEVRAREQSLNRLKGGSGVSALATPWSVELGRVTEGGEVEPLPSSGGELTEGDALCLRIRNDGEEAIYVSVLNVGVSGKVTLLTTSEPSGIELFSNDEYVLGYREHQGLVGLRLSWPDAVPRARARTDALVVIASDQPLDARALESKGMEDFELEVERVSRGGSTELRYAVRHLDFQLHPLHGEG